MIVKKGAGITSNPINCSKKPSDSIKTNKSKSFVIYIYTTYEV